MTPPAPPEPPPPELPPPASPAPGNPRSLDQGATGNPPAQPEQVSTEAPAVRARPVMETRREVEPTGHDGCGRTWRATFAKPNGEGVDYTAIVARFESPLLRYVRPLLATSGGRGAADEDAEDAPAENAAPAAGRSTRPSSATRSAPKRTPPATRPPIRWPTSNAEKRRPPQWKSCTACPNSGGRSCS